MSPQDTQANVGSSLLLPCVAYSTTGEGLKIAWKKGNKPLVNVTDRLIVHEQTVMNKSGLIFVKSVLEICAINPADIGNYSCTASENGGGSDNATFELTIPNLGKRHYLLMDVQ